MTRIYRDKNGRFTRDLRKVKSVTIGERTFKKLDYVKKLLRKEKEGVIEKKKIEKVEIPIEIPVKEEIYQTQLGRLDGTHTQKFEEIIDWLDIDTEKKFVDSFKRFFDRVFNKRENKSTDVKFGVIAEDKETGQAVSKFSNWTDLIFDKKAVKHLFQMIKDWFESLKELAERYKVKITESLITQIIMFKVKGHL